MGCLLRLAGTILTAIVHLVWALVVLIANIFIMLLIRLLRFGVVSAATGIVGIFGGDSAAERVAEDIMVRYRIPVQHGEKVKGIISICFVVLTLIGLLIIIAFALPTLRIILSALPIIRIFF